MGKNKKKFYRFNPNKYIISDVIKYFNKSSTKEITYEISNLAFNIVSNPYLFIINNICCGDVNDDNFLNEYKKIIKFNKSYFGKLNDKKTIIFLLILEENLFKINIIISILEKLLELQN